MTKKLSTEFVKEQVRKFGYEPLFDEYISTKEKLKIKCKKHGIFYISFEKLKIGRRCKKCFIEKLKYKTDDVKNIIKKAGFIPLFDEYINAKSKIKIGCKKHGEFYISFNKFLEGRRCKKCYLEKVRHSDDYVLEKFKEYDLIPLFVKVNNCKEKLPFICAKHSDLGVQYTNLEHILRKNKQKDSKKLSCKGCLKEYFISTRKEKKNNSRNYSEYAEWRFKVFSISNFTCKKCGISSKDIQAHHIVNFSKYPRFRTSTINGVTLCKSCHKKFHSKYGNRNNNAKQLKEFLGEKIEN